MHLLQLHDAVQVTVMKQLQHSGRNWLSVNAAAFTAVISLQISISEATEEPHHSKGLLLL